ncbi:MAG: cytochrome C oxidase subunit IV family protein [bacterium]|nr:cytochrome C oxidase subunit IV family protein [bacterium]
MSHEHAAATTAHGHAHDDHAHEDHGIKEYMKVFYALCFLTLLTVGAAAMPFPEALGHWKDTLHVTVGVIIAVIKVVAVMYIFMHLKFDHPLLRLVVYIPVALFIIMVFGLNFLETWDYTYITR